MITNFNFFASKDILDLCNHLKNKHWYILEQNPDKTNSIHVNWSMIPIEWHQHFKIENKYNLGALIALSDVVKIGPKIAYPSSNTFEALMNVEVRVPIKDYRQVYSSVIIDVPYDFYEKIVKKYEKPCPKGIITYWSKECQSIIMLLRYKVKDCQDITLYLNNDDKFATLEDELLDIPISNVDDDFDNEICKYFQRISINYNLLMTNYGVESQGPVQPKYAMKMKARNEPVLERIALTQNIKLFGKGPTYTHNDGTHASPTPHWRRGHWRNQPIKNGHKQIFIMPMWIGSGEPVTQSTFFKEN